MADDSQSGRLPVPFGAVIPLRPKKMAVLNGVFSLYKYFKTDAKAEDLNFQMPQRVLWKKI